METFRTFVAIELPPEIRRDVAKLIGDDRGVRWVPKDNLHLTLKFLGDVDNVDVPAVCDVAAEACGPIDAFEITLSRADAMPTRDKARTLAIAIDDPTGNLLRLVNDLDAGYADLGFRREPRDYVPNLTLARARGGSRRIDDAVVDDWLKRTAWTPRPMAIDRVNVTASFLDNEGPTYQTLEGIEL